ncbi:MAG: EAL domain-containing protein [Myxococcota bacterium]|nr:EAL domain-containing protein [Myxococcota bacterium]
MNNNDDPDIHRNRVLLIEQHGARSARYGSVLEDAGLAVTCTAESAAATALTGADDFDAVVAVLGVPSHEGTSVLERLRQVDEDLQVILIAPAATMEGALFALDQRVFRFLVEPVDSAALSRIIEAAATAGIAARARREALARAQLDADALSSLRQQFGRAVDGLWVAYQPIVRATTGATVAFEALMRSTEKSLPDPKSVLVAAERCHSLPVLGRVIRRVVADDLDRCAFETFVNLHPCDLDDEELYSEAAPLTRHAHRVVLEITERASLDTVSDPARKFAALRKLGYRLAIDDLGAGYAGLSSVVTLEPEFVKIDMSLVRGIATSRTRRSLVRLLVDMAKAIEADVIAEGIETAEERSVLADLGCDLMQGYLFGRAARPCSRTTADSGDACASQPSVASSTS